MTLSKTDGKEKEDFYNSKCCDAKLNDRKIQPGGIQVGYCSACGKRNCLIVFYPEE